MDVGKLKYKSLLFISSVEDDNTLVLLKEIFKEVFVEISHKESVHRYFGPDRTSEAEIDVVLYDIDEKNIVCLKQIRDINHKIPMFTLSSDYSNIDSLLLTQQKIYYSFQKPLDKNAFTREAYYALKEVSKRKFDAYLKKIAIVSKTDATGKIIYANELFCEISGYTKEELMDSQHSIVRHPSTPKTLFENLWKTITSGNAWHGILKNLSKNEEDYYLNATIFPTLNSKKEIIGYLNISFVVTKDEQNKAKLKQYILSQKSAQIKTNQTLEHKIQEKIEVAIEKEKVKFSELRKIDYELQDSLNTANVTKRQFVSRVQYLEYAIKKISEKDKNSDTQLRVKLKESRQENYETSKKNEKLEKSNEAMAEKLEKAQASITIFQGYVDDYRKKIDNLNDVISSNEKDLGKFKK